MIDTAFVVVMETKQKEDITNASIVKIKITTYITDC